MRYDLEGWVKVEDRLPEAYQWVLTASINATTTSNPHDMQTGYFLGFTEWAVKSEHKRTHWMPLPKLPKGENNESK